MKIETRIHKICLHGNENDSQADMITKIFLIDIIEN